VFIIERSNELIDAYHEIFKILGFKIDFASSGEEAINKLDRRIKRPGIVLLSNQLPDKSGFKTMSEILQKDSSMNILYVSENEKSGMKAIECGASAFIKKPFSLQELVTALVENMNK
jgi:DNA-binding response OmpR family regulator